MKPWIHMRGMAAFCCGKYCGISGSKKREVNLYEQHEPQVYHLFGKLLCLWKTWHQIIPNLLRLCLCMSSCWWLSLSVLEDGVKESTTSWCTISERNGLQQGACHYLIKAASWRVVLWHNINWSSYRSHWARPPDILDQFWWELSHIPFPLGKSRRHSMNHSPSPKKKKNALLLPLPCTFWIRSLCFRNFLRCAYGFIALCRPIRLSFSHLSPALVKKKKSNSTEIHLFLSPHLYPSKREATNLP